MRKSPEECQQLCQETDQCVVFTFRPDKGQCWLKHTKSTAQRSTGAISGNRQCEGEWFNYFSVYIHVYYHTIMH